MLAVTSGSAAAGRQRCGSSTLHRPPDVDGRRQPRRAAADRGPAHVEDSDSQRRRLYTARQQVMLATI